MIMRNLYDFIGRQSFRPRAERVPVRVGPTRSSARHDVFRGAQQAAVSHAAAAATTAAASHSAT